MTREEHTAGAFAAAIVSQYPSMEDRAGWMRHYLRHVQGKGMDPAEVYQAASLMMFNGTLPPYEDVAP